MNSRAAIVAWVGLVLLPVGCAAPKVTPELQGVKVPAGTPVNLILLQPIRSGTTATGTEVSLAVIEPVQVENREAIPAGTIVRARVSRSRGQDGFRAMANQPARLEITFDPVAVTGGEPIPLTGRPGGTSVQSFEMNRSNTNIAATRQATTDAERAAVENLWNAWENGDMKDVDAGTLQTLATNFGLENVGRLQTAADVQRTANLVDQLRRGQSLAGFLMPDGGLALSAAFELVGFAGRTGRSLSRTLSGRNIDAPVGMRLTAFTVG